MTADNEGEAHVKAETSKPHRPRPRRLARGGVTITLVSALLSSSSARAADPDPARPADPAAAAPPKPGDPAAAAPAKPADPAAAAPPKPGDPAAIAPATPADPAAIAPARPLDATKPPPLFRVDPIADAVLIAAGLGFSGIDELILSTGEIAPQRPGSTSNLLGIDRIAVTQTIDPHANTYSNIGLGLALGFAALDPVLSAFRDGSDVGLVDATLYGESLSITLAITDLTKIAFRRPRPIAYKEQAALDAEYGGAANAPSISDTDATLSFFSGHASIIAATSATATYLAFMRSPGTWRPWVTLAAGTLLTAGVSYERVRAGAHFPTDVIAGALAGGCIGVLVPHLHRFDSGGHHIWVGANPMEGGGGVTVGGLF